MNCCLFDQWPKRFISLVWAMGWQSTHYWKVHLDHTAHKNTAAHATRDGNLCVKNKFVFPPLYFSRTHNAVGGRTQEKCNQFSRTHFLDIFLFLSKCKTFRVRAWPHSPKSCLLLTANTRKLWSGNTHTQRREPTLSVCASPSVFLSFLLSHQMALQNFFLPLSAGFCRMFFLPLFME